MLTPEIIASREKTLAAHLHGESTKDVDAVLATFTGVPSYDLVSVGKTVRGTEDVRNFLQTFFDSMGPNTHIGEAFYHADDATAVEVLTVFPDGFDGQQRGQVVEVRSMGVFLFDGDKMHTEKLYADVSPLVPFMPWLVEA
jgi:limonene-1,2-epoxide hydrolase